MSVTHVQYIRRGRRQASQPYNPKLWDTASESR